jgi:predicted amidohydrolase
MIEPYGAVCVQNEVRVCTKRSEIRANVERCCSLIDKCAVFFGRKLAVPVRLVAFGEYHLQDWRGVTAPWWDHEVDPLDVCITMPGEETDALARKAKQHGFYIAGHALELDPNFPGYFFNTGFLISPEGEIVYKRRKSEHAGYLMYASPHDVLTKYMETYGKNKSVGETLFPVIDTEIGKIGMCMCYEMMIPEVHRQLVANGAEVIVRPTAEMDMYTSEPRNISLTLDRARAIENVAYYVVPHIGPAIYDGARDEWAGGSVIINYEGLVLAKAQTNGETLIGAVIDVDRQQRLRRVGASMPKSVIADGVRGLPLYRPESYDYLRKRSYPADLWAERPQTRKEKWELIKKLGETDLG